MSISVTTSVELFAFPMCMSHQWIKSWLNVLQKVYFENHCPSKNTKTNHWHASKAKQPTCTSYQNLSQSLQCEGTRTIATHKRWDVTSLCRSHSSILLGFSSSSQVPNNTPESRRHCESAKLIKMLQPCLKHRTLNAHSSANHYVSVLSPTFYVSDQIQILWSQVSNHS